MKEQLLSDVDELADRVGEFIRYWGFKKIHGRLWCHLFLSKEPLDATELILRLGVSKALMSQSLAELLEFDVVMIIQEDGERRKKYVTNPHILNVITSVLRKREQMILGDVMAHFRSVNNFSEEQMELVGIDPQKLKKLGNMVGFAEKMLASFLRFESISFKAFKQVFE